MAENVFCEVRATLTSGHKILISSFLSLHRDLVPNLKKFPQFDSEIKKKKTERMNKINLCRNEVSKSKRIQING